jgi:hypothetical protein
MPSGATQGGAMLSINVDNPLTFNSSIADEFAYIFFALLRAGASGDTASRWLDKAREAGWQSRFTLPASRAPEILKRLANTSNIHADQR